MNQELEKIMEEYILKAPEKMRSFIASGDWKTGVDSVIQRFNLDETKTNYLKNEIIFVLIGMEPKSDFMENIKRELGIDSNTAEWITEDVNKNIFSQVEKEIDQMWASGETDEEGGVEQIEEKNKNNIGKSFEEIILNQARAMQPAREAGSGSQQPVTSIKEEEKANSIENEPERKVIHNYIGNDPYREPAE